MHPTVDVKQTDPHHVLTSRADEQLARAYEQIKSADEQLARMEEQLSKLERDPAHSRSRPPRDRSWRRGLVGSLLAACIIAAALFSQSSHGDVVARWAPQLISALSLSAEKLGLPARLNPSSVQLAAAEPAPLGQTPLHDAAPSAASASLDPAQLLQTMARDLATVEREIEQLRASQQELASNNAKDIEHIKASQEQLARDNAKFAELLRASQEQLAQLIARASEQNLRPKTSAPQPIASATRKPVPTPAAPHASAHPQAPMQLRPE